MRLRSGLVLLVLSSAALLAAAGQSPSPGANAAAEQERLVAISAGLRCLVCQGQSLYGSPAALAEDLRREVHTLIEQGKSDHEIVDLLRARYGDLLLYDEPYGAVRWSWLGLGVALFLAGAGALLYRIRRRRIALAAAPLLPEDHSHKRLPLRFR